MHLGHSFVSAWLRGNVVERVGAVLRGLLAARGTTTWLAIVTAMGLVLSHGSQRLNTALLLSSSTNLHNLRTDPLTVLTTSAFFVDSFTDYLEFALICLVIVAPLENAIGFLRWLAGLIAGHVGATLLVAVALSTSLLSTSERPGRVVDVGVSYGLASLVAVFVYLLHGWQRIVLAILIAAMIIPPVVTSGQFSDWGHLIACGLGIALGPILVRGARPLFKPTPVE